MSLLGLRQSAQEWLGQGQAAIVVEIIEAQGSVPRGLATRMLVAAQQVLGTVGGGHLELMAIAGARKRLAQHRAEASEQHFALGPTLGQCCGGAVTLRYAPLSAELLAAWEPPPPRFTLQLYGAGHVGRAIVQVLAGIDCQVQWIDERESEFPHGAELPPHIKRVCVEPVEAEVALAPPGAYYLVLTHSHDLDMAITAAILARADFGYLGLIGSKTKRTRFMRRFEERGVAPETLARLTCPIGLPGISGKEPGVMAVAVVGQLLQTSTVSN
jgi:xanthine dehydrogenase accessory factor